MEKIRVENLRSLKDTGEIAIKKMNILVGNNSSGKSTFLRIFPLLKQTFNKKINGPILWCGDDDDYVDFGSFGEALNYTAKDECIRFMFELNFDLTNYLYEFKHFEKLSGAEKVKVEFSIKSSQNLAYEYISVFRYVFREYDIEVNYSEKNEIIDLSINGNTVNLEKKDDQHFLYLFGQELFDISLYAVRRNAIANLRRIFDISEDEGMKQLEEYLSYVYFSKITKEDNRLRSRKEIHEKTEKLCTLKSENEMIQWVLLYFLISHFWVISSYLRSYFKKVYYIAPVRATAERYYRLRNFAVEEVDCRGENLPIFLNSLSGESFLQFQKWTKENLGFEIIKTTSEGHVSLKIKRTGQGKAVNLSDTGFGYSQILPIVTQIWYIAKKIEEENEAEIRLVKFDIPTTIVIEQPELHLHPSLQAKLIDIMAKVARQGNVNFIIETHSETMINRIGHVIARGELKKNEVGITIFEKKLEEDNTVVRQGGYDDEGYLENWPIGFFEPEED